MKRVLSSRFPLSALLLGGAMMLSGHSVAAPTYSCDANPEDPCNGNEYAVYIVSHVGNTYQIGVDIKVLDTYTGNHWSDVVDSIAIKNFVSNDNYTNASLVSAPSALSNWGFDPHELSANGCNTGNTRNLCAEANDPYAGMPFGLGDVLTWVFQFESAVDLSATAHIKYVYEEYKCKSNGQCAWDKIGSLGSWDIALQNGNSEYEPPNPTPEPATLTLLGAALAGFGWVRRRKLS